METKAKVQTALIQGQKHKRTQMPCQDACGYCVTPDGWLVLSVADGVSASPLSEEAAQAAVEAVKDFFQAFAAVPLAAESMHTVLQAAMNYALARTEDVRTREPGAGETTLELAVLTPDERLFLQYVGDGGIYVQTRDETWLSLAEKMRDGEDSVAVLSDGPQKWRFTHRSLKKVTALLMTTDGVRQKIDEDPDAAGLFLPWEDGNYQEHCEKALLTQAMRSMDDDAALVMWRAETTSLLQRPEEKPDGFLQRLARTMKNLFC